jgi:hypothetical protein
MGAIVFEIEKIIPEVGSGCAKAHGEEGGQQAPELPDGVEMMVGEEREGDEEVLRPLVDPLGTGPVGPPRRVRAERPGDVVAALHRPERGSGVKHRNRLACTSPDMMAREGIPRVVEALLAEARDEVLRFPSPLEVDLVVRGDDPVEGEEQLSDRDDRVRVGRGDEENRPPGLLLAQHPRLEFPVHRRGRERLGEGPGELGLEPAPALEEPKGHPP